MSVIIINKPTFNPTLKVIFSDRVNVHPTAPNAFKKRSSRDEGENSF